MPATILLVEDEPALLALMSTALKGAGYVVREAHNGPEAIAFFDKNTWAFDLLITDMRMPRVDGPELVDILRARRPTLKVIFISGVAMPLRGADAFLAKPFTRPQLLETVAEVLSRA